MTSGSPHPTNRPAVQAVIFDFDGVLADTERLHLHAFQQVFGARGWTLDEATYFDRYLGYDDQGLVSAFGTDQRLGLRGDDERRLVEEKGRVFEQSLAQGAVLFPDAAACVARLGAHYLLGIASGALKPEIRHILGAAGLLSRFPVIVAAEDVSACKPNPEPYLTAARALGVDPSVCLAIEDSAPGLQAARTAGLRTIGITTTSPREHLRADVVVDRLAEITVDVVRGVDQRPGRQG